MSAFEREFHCKPENVDESAGLSEHLADNRAIEEWQKRKHAAREEVLATYTLQLIGPPPTDRARNFALDYERTTRLIDALNILDRAQPETEENLTDLLPHGYSVRIRKWDAEEEK